MLYSLEHENGISTCSVYIWLISGILPKQFYYECIIRRHFIHNVAHEFIILSDR